MICAGRIADDDSLFRHSVYPVAFKKGAHDWDKYWYLTNQANGFLGSLAWEKYVPTTELVHEYGCRLASCRNEKKLTSGNYKDRDRQVYAGAYKLTAKAIRELSSAEGLAEILSADVVHHIENGEIAHADLKIVLKPGGDFHIAATKTAVIVQLMNSCSGPLKHVCDCDHDILDHPSSRLVTAPAGPYSDHRSQFLRWWCIIRFQICSWLWHRRNKHA